MCGVKPTSDRILAADRFHSQKDTCHWRTNRKNWLAQVAAEIDGELVKKFVLSRFGRRAEHVVATNLGNMLSTRKSTCRRTTSNEIDWHLRPQESTLKSIPSQSGRPSRLRSLSGGNAWRRGRGAFIQDHDEGLTIEVKMQHLRLLQFSAHQPHSSNVCNKRVKFTGAKS